MGGQFNEIGAEILDESDWSWSPMPGASIVGLQDHESKAGFQMLSLKSYSQVT